MLVIAAAASLTGGFSTFLQPVNQASLGSISTTITGTSTGSNSSTTLNDTSKSFTPGSLVGDTITINTGTGAGESATITSNTNNQVTVDKPWPTTPDTSSKYTITTPGAGASASSGSVILKPAPNQNGQQLQLNTFTMITMTPTTAPTPATACVSTDGPRTANCSCRPPSVIAVTCNSGNTTPSVYLGHMINETCPDEGFPCQDVNPIYLSGLSCTPTSCVYLKDSLVIPGYYTIPANPNYSKYENCNNVANVCFDKPVIYLYSDRIIKNVSVKLVIPGRISKSIPSYPAEGWNNITVIPGGIIKFNNTLYNELFYETNVNRVPNLSTGYVYPIKNLSTNLNQLVTNLGLKQSERDEFINYWLPKLYALDKPYIYVGVLSGQIKDSVDKIVIYPKPDATIAFLTLFKGLDTDISITAPKLPIIPERKGFVMVEWGGAIAN